jgi:hypothetical protein
LSSALAGAASSSIATISAIDLASTCLGTILWKARPKGRSLAPLQMGRSRDRLLRRPLAWVFDPWLRASAISRQRRSLSKWAGECGL